MRSSFPSVSSRSPTKEAGKPPPSLPCSGFGRQWSSSSVIVSLCHRGCFSQWHHVNCRWSLYPALPWCLWFERSSLPWFLFFVQSMSYRAKTHSFFFLFCFLTCHCLSYSKAFLTAAFFVQVLSHIDFPSPKL